MTAGVAPPARRSVAGPIDAYVRQLDRQLAGPARQRAELLRELTDGLEDAAAAHRRAGLSPARAEARAVAECGPVDEVAAAFQEELAAGQARRTAILLALTLPAQVVAWGLVWRLVPPAALATADFVGPSWLSLLSDATDLAGLGGGLLAMVMVGLQVWSARSGRAARPFVVAQAVTGLVTLLLVSGVAAALNLALPGSSFRMINAEPVIAALGLLTMAVNGVQMFSVTRTCRLAFGQRSPTSEA